jgi:hypothetical protein
LIVVKVELWPHGHEERKELLGVARIWNDATGDQGTGNYGFEINSAGDRRTIRKGEIKGFPRLRLLAWDLLHRVLEQGFGDRN